MSKGSQDPEIDLLIMESLELDFKSVAEISKETEIDPEDVLIILDELHNQGMAIEKKGTLYRLASEEDE